MAAALRSRPGGARGTKEGKRARSVRIPPDRRESFSVEGHTVPAAVIKDSACVNGKLHEMAWGYHAQADNGTVYYLGEDVNIHRKGKVVGHSGAFRYGRDTTTFGIAMPAHPTGARRSTFERIPGQGSERNRVTDARPRFVTPARTFNRALEIKGYVLPEREKEIKYYARGVGLIGELSATSNATAQRPLRGSALRAAAPRPNHESERSHHQRHGNRGADRPDHTGDLVVVAAQHPPRGHERTVPHRRAQHGEQDEAAHSRHEPPKQHEPAAVAVKPVVGTVEVGLGQPQQPPVAEQQRTAAVASDRV
jgi:hypothetical protein